jgi:predicted AlkP superfamily phosphohydrolase/phosphomutase
VFDATDRIQHMFFRYLDPEHPANRGKDVERHKDAIADLYRRADALVGETRARLRKGDVLLVASDHGFKQFQRGVNLNAWFRDNGYLFLRSDPHGGPLPAIAEGTRFECGDVDWPRTRAYTNGLAGFYLNVRGREHDGCVDPTDAPALKRELIDRLRGLPDPGRDGQEAITELWASEDIYRGPYRENGPDVIVGYKPGYRADWDAAVGAVSGVAISDNTRSWSGDHCMDPRQVPGVLFSSVPFASTRPNLVDLAPTVLDLLGLPRPAHMTGRSIFSGDGEAA